MLETDLEKPLRPKFTKRQKLAMGLCAWLVVSTLIVLFFAKMSVDRVQDMFQREARVHVGNLGALVLVDTPARFIYDRTRGDLVHAGAVGDDAKRVLIAAVRNAPAELAAEKNAYMAGVARMAYDSAQRSGALVIALLFLGGMAGALGVQLRSIVNFVGHACHTGDLDVSTWWPYYLIRPLTGFVLGAVLVAVVQAGLLTVEGTDAGKVMWWAAVAFLAGFGEEEFTQRLRNVSKTLFGEGAGNRERTPETSAAAAAAAAAQAAAAAMDGRNRTA